MAKGNSVDMKIILFGQMNLRDFIQKCVIYFYKNMYYKLNYECFSRLWPGFS